MTEVLKDKLSALRCKIYQQRNTIEALKRDRHECTDPERQLRQMVAELSASDRSA